MAFFVLLAVSLLVATSSAAPKNTKFDIKTPEECKGKGFCTIRPEGYDEIEEEINNLLPPFLMSNRVGEATTETYEYDRDTENDNCPSITRRESVYLYEHPTNPGKKEVIVQTKRYQQYIDTVTCDHAEIQSKSIKEGSPQCFRKLGLGNFGMKLSCQESKANRPLLVYEAGSIKVSNFSVSVCCSCQINESL